MALCKCTECGSDMSDLAEACPHCGAPNPNYDPSTPKPGETYFPCHKHSDKKSVKKCSICGKGMCSACAVDCVELDDNSILCPECYLSELNKETSRAKRSRIFNSICLVWYALSIILALVSLVSGLFKGFEFSHVMFNVWASLGFASFIPLIFRMVMGSLRDFFGVYGFIKNPLAMLVFIFVLSFALAPFAVLLSTYRTVKNLKIGNRIIAQNKNVAEQYTDIVSRRSAMA